MPSSPQPSWLLAIAELDRVLAKARSIAARAEAALDHACDCSNFADHEIRVRRPANDDVLFAHLRRRKAVGGI